MSDKLFDEVNWKQQVKVRYRWGISWWHMNRSGWHPIKRWVIHWLWWEDTEPRICNCSHLRSALYCIYDVKDNVIDATQHQPFGPMLGSQRYCFEIDQISPMAENRLESSSWIIQHFGQSSTILSEKKIMTMYNNIIAE